MKLTYPKTHSPEDLRDLLEEFKSKNPSVYSEWVDIERSPDRIAKDELHAPQIALYEFLRSRVDHDGSLALMDAWMDMRGLIRRDNLFN